MHLMIVPHRLFARPAGLHVRLVSGVPFALEEFAARPPTSATPQLAGQSERVKALEDSRQLIVAALYPRET